MLDLRRRQPGLRFEAQPPPPPDVLPRMDVAGFVGYASAGPLDVPVAIDDAVRFADVFGPDAPLAWDGVRGEDVNALLGPAVRSFFANGGRRCFVVRVAGRGAKTDTFEVPGVVLTHSQHGAIRPLVLRARSAGSWADALKVGTSVSATAVELQPVGAAPLRDLTFDAIVTDPAAVRDDDVLRLSVGNGWRVSFAVQVDQKNSTARRLRIDGREATWVRLEQPPPGAAGDIHFVDDRGRKHRLDAVALGPGEDGLLRLAVPAHDAAIRRPRPGGVVWARFGRRRFAVELAGVEATDDPAATLVTGTSYRTERRGPVTPPRLGPSVLAELLSLELWVDDGEGDPVVLGGLGLADGHPRWVGDLLDDATIYAPRPGATSATGGNSAADDAGADLREATLEPRFPLAGYPAAQAGGIVVPLGASLLPGPYLGAQRPLGSERARDGLAQVDARAFMDRDPSGRLDRGLGTASLVTLPERARTIAATGRPLTGMHALWDVDDVTIVAAPDACLPAWRPAPAPRRPASGTVAEAEADPQDGRFLDCDRWRPAPPVLSRAGGPPPPPYVLTWESPAGPEATFELQESLDPDWLSAVTVYTGADRTFEVHGRAGGTRWYRVRAIVDGRESDWSAPLAVQLAPPPAWRLARPEAYDPAALFTIQRALMRMCAARGDVLAVLSLPEHYREDDVVAHVSELRTGPGLNGVPEPEILSYGAAYHPWVVTADPNRPDTIRHQPPDGAAAGVMAATAATRGAWIAPANRALHGVVALSPPLGEKAPQNLLDAQVNQVRQEARGFMWLAADTLGELEVRPIGVRRLLGLLRRLALLHGPTYAFEPLGGALERGVQRQFERLLARLFRLGAFAGPTRAEAYQVATGSPPNTELGLEHGQFVIELKVAPSHPLEFLVVRLVRRGLGALTVETA